MTKTYLQLALIGGMIMTLSITGCEKRAQPREYTEIVIRSPLRATGKLNGMPHPPATPGMEGMPASVTPLPLTWQTPSGWVETKGEGMRLVSFKPADQNQSFDCSVVLLGGPAGGLKANIVRWLGQLQVPVPSADVLDDFLSKQTKFVSQGNLTGTILDFSQLQSDTDDQTNSMLATMIELPENVIFVKLTGSKTAVKANKDRFAVLCQSLRLNEK